MPRTLVRVTTSCCQRPPLRPPQRKLCPKNSTRNYLKECTIMKYNPTATTMPPPPSYHAAAAKPPCRATHHHHKKVDGDEFAYCRDAILDPMPNLPMLPAPTRLTCPLPAVDCPSSIVMYWNPEQCPTTDAATAAKAAAAAAQSALPCM